MLERIFGLLHFISYEIASKTVKNINDYSKRYRTVFRVEFDTSYLFEIYFSFFAYDDHLRCKDNGRITSAFCLNTIDEPGEQQLVFFVV